MIDSKEYDSARVTRGAAVTNVPGALMAISPITADSA
jgi:hypothetical protein